MHRRRHPTERQLAVLRLVAAAGGYRIDDHEAADECVDCGWLYPVGAFGHRLTGEGRVFVQPLEGRRLGLQGAAG